MLEEPQKISENIGKLQIFPFDFEADLEKIRAKQQS